MKSFRKNSAYRVASTIWRVNTRLLAIGTAFTLIEREQKNMIRHMRSGFYTPSPKHVLHIYVPEPRTRRY